MAKKVTPTQAVKAFCRDCCCGVLYEVKTCTGCKPIMGGQHKCCPFYEHRLGKKRVSVKTIRKHCVKICMNGSTGAVRDCTSENCALYPFRMGVNPNYGKKNRKQKSKVAKKFNLSALGLSAKEKKKVKK